MIISTIKQFGLKLYADPEEIPFQYSSNIQMQFIKDENYNDYTVVGYYIPPGENEAKLLSINDDGTFILGPDCFKQRGTLSFSFNLINSIEEVHLGSIDFEVRYSFGDGDTILPEPEEVWISLVTQVAKDAIREEVALVKQKANEALQSASLANDKASEAEEYANNANQSAGSASLSASSALTAKNDAIAASNQALGFSNNASESAIEAKNSADEALENANASNKAIKTINQIKTQIEDKANEFDTNYQEKQNAFNQSVTSANDLFDKKVVDANNDLDSKLQQANTTIDEKVTEATNQATKAKEEADRATLATDDKLDKNQGTDNVGKVMIVGEDGELTPTEYKSGSDNKLIGTVAKSENPNITDSYQAEMMNLKLYGKSTQETTTGKNLFDVNAVYNEKNLDKSFGGFGVWLYPLDLPDGTYTLTAQNAPYTKGGYLAIGVYKEDSYSVKGWIAHPSIAQKVATLELIGNKFIALSNSMSVNETVKSEIGNIQLEEGSTATEYEPYTGGQPSPNPQYPQPITAISQFEGNIRNSFQLLDKTLFKPNVASGVTLAVDDNGIKLSGTATASAGFTHSFDNTYFKKIFKSGNVYVRKNTSLNVLFTLYIRNGTELLGYANDTTPFNITEEIVQNPNTRGEFYIFISSGVTVNGYINPMVYQDGDGTWQPFDSNPQEFTYTPTNPMYSTQDGSIADYVDVEKGVEVYQFKKAVFNGTNATFIRLNDNNVYYTSLLNDAITPYELEYEYYIWCDKLKTYTPKTSIDSLDNAIRYGNGSGTSQLLFLKVDDTITTVEQLNTWLQSNPITVVYVLQIPTVTPIPQEQLQILRALYTYNGVTNFLCNAPVSFDYEKSLQIVIQNIWNAIGQTNANILLNGGNQ